jgi:hypothetical protein
MSNRIAQSSLVSAVALIAIGLTLVGIIAYTIKSAGPSLSPIACTEENLQSSINIVSACIDNDKSEVRLSLSRDLTSPEITILDISMHSSKDARWRCANTCGDCEVLNAGEEKTYYLNELPIGKATIEIYANGCRSTFMSADLESC